MIRTHIPRNVRYCSDGCPRCFSLYNLPLNVVAKDVRGVRFAYACRACGYRWSTWWALETAKGQSADTIDDLLRTAQTALTTKPEVQ